MAILMIWASTTPNVNMTCTEHGALLELIYTHDSTDRMCKRLKPMLQPPLTAFTSWHLKRLHQHIYKWHIDEGPEEYATWNS